MQSGESEPLDLGLPISNLDGLRVVLDVAEHSPGKGEEHILRHTLLSIPNVKTVSFLIPFACVSVRRCCSADKQKVAPSKSHLPASTSRNQSTTVRSPTASYFQFLALECSITHRMSPLPGWWYHATKCLCCCLQSPMSVCNVVQMCRCIMWLCLCLCGLLLWGR